MSIDWLRDGGFSVDIREGLYCRSYAVLLLDFAHAFRGNWSGIASLANMAAVVVLLPPVIAIAWRYRATRTMAVGRIWWFASLAFPVLFAGFWGFEWIAAIRVFG